MEKIVESYCMQDILDIEEKLEVSVLSKIAITQDMQNDNCHFLVLFIDNMPISYLAYTNIVDHIDLTAIATIPIMRKKGYAMLLLNKFMQIKEQDKNVFLEVRISNIPAISLYEKIGFKKISIRKGYYSNPKEDAAIYCY